MNSQQRRVVKRKLVRDFPPGSVVTRGRLPDKWMVSGTSASPGYLHIADMGDGYRTIASASQLKRILP